MAHITVSIDGVARAAISCDGFDVVAVNVGGTRVEQELATVHVSSSRYPEQADSTYLIWVDAALVPGQKLLIAFAERGAFVGAGKTIDELHPEDSDTDAETDFKLTAEMIQGLLGKPKVRAAWKFEVRGPKQSHYESRTTETDTGLASTYSGTPTGLSEQAFRSTATAWIVSNNKRQCAITSEVVLNSGRRWSLSLRTNMPTNTNAHSSSRCSRGRQLRLL